MRANFVEILSRIGLNLTNVEHFIEAACSLADDNPAIRREIHEAARQVRSSGQLIDHLRSLFAHQQTTVDWRQRLLLTGSGPGRSRAAGHEAHGSGGAAADNNLGYFTYTNKQTLIKAARCLVANVAKILYLTDEIVLRSGDVERARERDQSAGRLGAASGVHSLGPAGRQMGQREDRRANAEGNCASATANNNQDDGDYDDDDKLAGPILSDRLDNVANYSQLLRTFGEFSADLIDLGNCIMLARHVGGPAASASWVQERTRACPCASEPSGLENRSRADGLRRAYPGSHPDDVENEEQIGAGVARGDFAPEQYAAYRQAAANQHGHIRPSSSSYSVLAERRRLRDHNQLEAPVCGLATDEAQFGRREPSRPEVAGTGQRRSAASSHLANHEPGNDDGDENNNNDDDDDDGDDDEAQHKQVAAAGAGLIGAGAKLGERRGPNCKMLARIHDVQVLFQVNRLIIERSILLLLSASKCCLRRGQELERGFEARKLIGLQIRVSIGIIMALVKSSVFGEPIRRHDDQGERRQARRAVLAYSKRLEQNCAETPAQTNPNSSQPLETSQWDILDHFLVTNSNTSNAFESIRIVQSLVELFAGVRNQDQLACSLELAIQLARANVADIRLGPLKPAATNLATRDELHELELGAARQLNHAGTRLKQVASFPPVPMMDKRQLVAALNFVFLGELKLNLVERLHEFTDCAYTRHEHREAIVSLLVCIKSVLHRFVKLIYRLRRRIASPSEPNQLSLLRQLAHQLLDCCQQLSYELQTAAIELADELDKLNADLELIKQLKHNCLVGDIQKARQNCAQFSELAEQLVETCRMLNQIAPANKLKISTKSLAGWFQLNHQPLARFAVCLSESPHSKTAKDCVWTYLQIWSSFYDDFCQLARQLAYLAHSNCDLTRAGRVISLRDQINNGGIHSWRPPACVAAPVERHHSRQEGEQLVGGLAQGDGRVALPDSPLQSSLGSLQSLAVCPTKSNQQLGRELANQPQTDSPRSLDHYHGFGPNYRRWHDSTTTTAGTTVPTTHRGGSAMGVAGAEEAWPADTPDLVESGAYPVEALNQNDELFCAGCESSPQPRIPSNCSSTFSSVFTDYRSHHQSGVHSHRDDSLGSIGQANRGRLSSGGLSSLTPLSALPITPLAPLSIRVDPTAPPIEPPSVPARRSTADSQNRSPLRPAELTLADVADHNNNNNNNYDRQHHHQHHHHHRHHYEPSGRQSGAPRRSQLSSSSAVQQRRHQQVSGAPAGETGVKFDAGTADGSSLLSAATLDGTQASNDKWSDSEADAIVRGARETAQMALSMYQFTRGEGDLNTTQDLFTQAELFAEEANELYKEVRCFSYKVPAGDLKKELLFQLATIPALVQQLQFTVKNPTVGKAATFAKVDSVIRETKSLMEAVNRVVEATLACRQHYNMASASLRKRTRTLSPTYRNDKFEFDAFGSPDAGRSLGGAFGGPGGGRHAGASAGGMGSEPDI